MMISLNAKRFQFWKEGFQSWFRQWYTVAPLGEYNTWQQQFLRDRLKLSISFAMPILASVAILCITVMIPALNATQNPQRIFTEIDTANYLYCTILQEMGLLLCLLLLRLPASNAYSGLLFLWFSWSILLLPQIQSIMRGAVELDSMGWIIGYMAQAILMPVRWRLHLLSQVSVLGVFVGASLLGLRDPTVPPEMINATYAMTALHTVSICLIADVGVFLYERLLRRESELRQRLRLLIHAVSHDLRNPVLGTVMVLKSLNPLNGSEVVLSKPVLDRMIDSSDRQLQLINLLIDAHNGEVEGIPLQCQSVQLAPLIESVIEDFQPYLNQSQAELKVNLPHRLPAIAIDRQQIRRVFEHLMTHILTHHIPETTINIEATLLSDPSAAFRPPSKKRRSSSCPPRWLLCTISDDGRGISLEQCHTSFNLYTQGPNARQTLSASLGLYICQQIIEAHGGAIGIYRNPNVGTTFHFTLPLAT